MPTIKVINEFDELLYERTFKEGLTFAEAAMSEWPEGFEGLTVFVMDPDMVLVAEDEAVDRPMLEGEVWTVALRPQFTAIGTFLATVAFAGVTYGQIALAVASLALSYLLKPEMPQIGAQYQWDDSDKPQFFSAQSNKMRPGSRVPEVFGKVRVWPDLIVEPWVKYSGDSQELKELYVVSNGKVTLTDERLHDEPISVLPQSAVKVYHPNEAWPVDFPVMRTNTFVSRVELPGPNETISFGITVDISTTGTVFVDVAEYFNNFASVVGTLFTIVGDGVAANNKTKIYTLVSVSGNGKTLTVTPNPSTTESITDGSLQFRGITDIENTSGTPLVLDAGGWIDVGQYSTEVFVTTSEFSDPGFAGTLVNAVSFEESAGRWGTYTAYAESDGPGVLGVTGTFPNRYIVDTTQVKPATFYFLRWANTGYSPAAPGDGFTTRVFGVPGVTIGSAFDIEFPNGMYAQISGGTPSAVEVEIQFSYRLKGTSTWTDTFHTLTTASGVRTPRLFTIETTWPSGEYECYFRRATDYTPDSSTLVTVDACRLVGLRGRQDVSSLTGDLLNVTLVELSLTTQNAAQVTQARSFNVLAQRWLPNYFGGNGGAVLASKRIRDAIMYTLVNDAGIDINAIDTTTLNAIHQDLVNISAKDSHFNGIIDQTMTTDDQLNMLAGNGRIHVYRRAGNIYFNRLKAGEIPRGLINARNKIEPESKTMNFSMSNEPDAIVVRFMNEDDDYNEDTIQYPGNVVPTNPSEQSVIGATNIDVVSRIAQYQWDKRIHERDLVEVSTTEDGILLAPGDVIAVTDHLTTELPIDGEVIEVTTVGITDDTFRFDQAIPAGTYVGRLRNKFGDMVSTEASITLTGDGDTHTITEWAGAIVPDGNTTQVGMLYSFTPIGTAAESELWHVQMVSPARDGSVKISALQYSDATYAADTSTGNFSAKKRIRSGSI